LASEVCSPSTRARQVTDRGSPGLDQRALALLIELGRYDRHLRRMHAGYAAAHLPAGTADRT
jgi:DNA-binding transcriptional MocR family regulator